MMRKIWMILASLLIGAPAYGQWQVGKDNIPIGRGPGVIGFQFVGVTVCAQGIDRTGIIDATVALQACIDASSFVTIPQGTYKISGTLLLQSNSTIKMNANVAIIQYTRDIPTFKAISKTNVHIFGEKALLFGEGSYCGNVAQAVTVMCPDGHVGSNTEAKGISLLGCTYCSVNDLRMKNHASMGIYIDGGHNIAIDSIVIEGTDSYSTPVLLNAVWQEGITIADSTDYGVVDNLTITSVNISGATFGITHGRVNSGLIVSSRQIIISDVHIHDIPGQHAYYMSQPGSITINGSMLSNIAFAGVKHWIHETGVDGYNFTAINIVAENVGGNMFEIASDDDASLNNVKLSGVGRNVNTGLGIDGRIRNVVADIQLFNVVQGFANQVGPLTDIDVDLTVVNAEQDAVLVSANNSNIRMRPKIYNPNTANEGRFGILLLSSSSVLTLFDPIIQDNSGLMVNGIHNASAGGVIKVFGSATITGASGFAVSNAGDISAWPLTVTISGGGGNFTGNLPFGQLPAAVTAAGSFDIFDVVAPATTTGRTALWADSTTKRIRDKDDTGVIGTTVIANACGASEAVTAVTVAGGVTCTGGFGSGSGSVTSVGLAMPEIFTISGSPVTTTGTLTATAAGTSGGIPYFSSDTALASSGALGANQIVLGGGAGVAPATLGSLGTATTVLHGNAAGAPSFGAVSLTGDVTGVLPLANGGTNCSGASGTCLDTITGFGTNGLIARTGSGAYAFRTITGTTAEITATNGDGVSGNPTLSLPTALTFTGKTVTGGTFDSPTFITPVLGIPASGVLTNATGYPLAAIANLNSNAATWLNDPTSAKLATAVSDETGSGALVFGTSPTLSAPIFSSIVNTGTLTLPTSTDTLVGKATTDIFTNKTFDTAETGNSFSINGVAATANTGTGSVVRANSPALVTPALGAATATSINGVTLDNNAWTIYVPVATAGGGGVMDTSVPSCGATYVGTTSGATKTVGKSVFWRAKFVITTLGTCTGSLLLSLPDTLQGDFACSGHNASLGLVYYCYGAASGNTITVLTNAGGSPLNSNTTFVFSGVYEKQ